MNTEQIVRECSWRFYASRYLNAARFGAVSKPHAAAMTIKGFAICDLPPACPPGEIRRLFQTTIIEAYPAFAWRFGDINYEPNLFAYDSDGVLHPFDAGNQLSVELASPEAESFWDFVEHECTRDEVRPQIFGEALRARIMIKPDGVVFVRFTFNHALVDGLMIFKFMRAWERSLGLRGARLRDLEPAEPRARHAWRTAHSAYAVEHLSGQDHPRMAQRGFDYLSILYEIAKGHWLTRIRQAIALPRDPLRQLAIAPVHKAIRFEEFRRLNEAEISNAARGTYLTALLDEYRNDPERGDRYIQRLFSSPFPIRQLSAWIAGQWMVSSFKFRHARYVAFPVVHPLQREGIAICNIWRHGGDTIVRLTRVRLLGHQSATGP